MSEYNFDNYGSMIRDSVRMEAYARALEDVVQPDSVVLDIGAGSGNLSLLAVRAGARHVFAVEPADVIELARELAAANGFADRITFFQGLSSGIALPEPADVIVSDLRGVLPLYTAHIPSIVEARDRHLAEGGTLVPLRDTLWAAPAQFPEQYEEIVSSWEATPYGLNIAGGRAYAANHWWKVSAPADALLAAPARLAVLDYPSISSPDINSSAQLEATRSGILHGMLVWFASELAGDVAFTNAPGKPEATYGQGFFPLLEPVDLMSGDVISFALSASLIGDEYVFRWGTSIAAASNPSCVKAAFTQSTLFASPLSPETLARHEEGHIATRTEDGDAAVFVLQRLDGRKTLGDVSREVERKFSELFRSADEAFRFVSRVAQKYGR